MIPIVNALTAYIPHFLALSASSPFWKGRDTGLASSAHRESHLDRDQRCLLVHPDGHTAAVVDVNGKPESVGVAQTFPKANPTFKLVSLTNGVAKIGLAGGNYASGAQTVALRVGPQHLPIKLLRARKITPLVVPPRRIQRSREIGHGNLKIQ